MKKNILNILKKIIICIIFVSIFSMSFYSYAIGDIFTEGKEFLAVGDDVDDTIDTSALKETSDAIYNTLLAVGVAVAIIVAMVLGIKFMWASADEKAKVKESLIPFVIGCFVVFGSFSIWRMVVRIGNTAESEQTYIGKGQAVYDINNDGKINETDAVNFNYTARTLEYLINGNKSKLYEDSTRHNNKICLFDYTKNNMVTWHDFDATGDSTINQEDVDEFRKLRDSIYDSLKAGEYKTANVTANKYVGGIWIDYDVFCEHIVFNNGRMG